MKIKISIILIFLIFASCNYDFHKRVYTKGFYVHRTGQKISLQDQVAKSTVKSSMPTDYKASNVLPEDVIAGILNQYNINSNADGLTAFVSKRQSEVETKYSLSNSDKIYTPRFYLQKSKKFAFYQFSDSSSEKKKSDSFFYVLAGFMGLATIGFLKRKQKETLKLTRWANKNKLKSRTLIAFLQTGIGTLGVLSGKELFNSGYIFSDSFAYVFGLFSALGFLALISQKKQGNIVLMNSFYLKKFSHIAIGVSFFMTSATIGNNLAQGKTQVSPMGYTIEEADKANFDESAGAKQVVAASSKSEGSDTGLIVGYVILALLLLVVLTVLTCAAFCTGGSALGIPVFLLSMLIMILVIRAMSLSVDKKNNNTMLR